MLTLYEFLALAENDQYQVAWNSEFLTDIRESLLVSQLYAVSDFFVEIQYNPMENKLVGIKAFKRGEMLNRYADSIAIGTF